MILFHNDYSEGCHEKVLEELVKTNGKQTTGYGEDPYCARAAQKIRKCCGREDAAVHFLVGGTQANLTVIASALRPHQGVLAADSGHINVHETGAIEATGHKVLWLPSVNGKIAAGQISDYVDAHRADPSFEHTVQPKMVYISNPTEWGTLYSKAELQAIAEVCREKGLYLFLDGARLGYGLMAEENDLTMEDLAKLCDVFYIGGTKMGALFGEAAVIATPEIQEDFRYLIKQRGGMLAKGRLLGLQFDTLFTDNLYLQAGRHADQMADKIRSVLDALEIPLLVKNNTNQIFPILPNATLAELEKNFTFTEQERISESHRAVRFCTSWATKPENVDALCAELERIHKNFIGN